MAHRHNVHKAHGGAAKHAEVDYGNKDVISAARKTGSNPGIKPIQKKDGGKVPGFKSGGRLDKRARGGATKSPFSAAAFKHGGHVKHHDDHDADDYKRGGHAKHHDGHKEHHKHGGHAGHHAKG